MKNNINNFLVKLLEKDYSQVNQILEKIIEDKIGEKVNKSAKEIVSGDFLKNKKHSKKTK